MQKGWKKMILYSYFLTIYFANIFGDNQIFFYYKKPKKVDKGVACFLFDKTKLGKLVEYSFTLSISRCK